jgi:predicted Zn finger-like uncharacterized protein
MIIECACKKYKFAVKAEEIGINGRVVQCGVCDQKWFQEPASTEEFRILKKNFIEEEEEKTTKKHEFKNKKTNKNYIPIKYENKSKTNYAKVFLTIFTIFIISILISFENKEYILSKNPEFENFFNLIEEFFEYLKEKYFNIIILFIPK